VNLYRNPTAPLISPAVAAIPACPRALLAGEQTQPLVVLAVHVLVVRVQDRGLDAVEPRQRRRASLPAVRTSNKGLGLPPPREAEPSRAKEALAWLGAIARTCSMARPASVSCPWRTCCKTSTKSLSRWRCTMVSSMAAGIHVLHAAERNAKSGWPPPRVTGGS
jgi:hypothetical protein